MDTSGKEAGVSNDDVPESISTGGEQMQVMESDEEFLSRAELGVACSSEKSSNLSMLMMHVANRESEYEDFISDEELILKDAAKKVLELDLLCGILDSEGKELESFMSTLQADIDVARKFMASYENLGEDLGNVGNILQNYEESLRQSLEQVSDIWEQSYEIQRNLLRFSEEDTRKRSKDELVEDDISDRRMALKMLDRSLARELDLDKIVADLKNVEENLKLRLHSSEHENLCMEEEDLVFLERLFEGENVPEVLMGISKELLGQIKKLIFSLNVSRTRENNLKSKLEDSIQELKAKDPFLQRTDSSNTKINEVLLAEEKCKLLEESNMELTKELNLLKASRNTTEMVDSLERRMSESDLLRRCAVASAEASQEKQNMLSSTIEDMENVIEKLKAKVSKAENLADSAEEKCIELSESNSDLSEKLRFLSGKMDCLKVSLHQAEESKKATAKVIRIRTKLITDLVMQLASERERLQKQISSLVKQNKILVNHSRETSKSQVNLSHNVQEDTEYVTSTVTMKNSNSANMDKKDQIEVGPDDSRLDFKTVRNIDARQLNVKYVIMMILVLVISIFVALLFQPPDSGF